MLLFLWKMGGELNPRRTKTPGATIGGHEMSHVPEKASDDGGNDHLGNAVPVLDRVVLAGAVAKEHLHFSAEVLVNGARTIEYVDAVVGCQARARADLRLVTGGKLQLDPGANQVSGAPDEDQGTIEQEGMEIRSSCSSRGVDRLLGSGKEDHVDVNANLGVMVESHVRVPAG
jgi:hypothetical protein